ncbi:hypothetical protein ILYODFUR_005747 [Ilyodon furcidens]|uniref:Uncharacterized protein n=1 Tax=Ilyodon furcidens TaxID=33524 RepID=A0ABV0UDR8_9TELE
MTKLSFSLRSQTDGREQKHRGITAARDHHTTTTMFDCQYGAVFLKCRCNMSHTFLKIHFSLRQYFLKCLGDHQDVLLANMRKAVCSFWSAVVWAIELSYCLFPIVKS